jgi:hypothetical protein
MLNKHLTDEEVQEYVLNNNSEAEISTHIEQCEACKARIETYRLLFTAIKQQPEPAFDFDLSALVLAQLPSPKSQQSRDTIFVYLLIAASILMTAVAFYIFRIDLLSLLPDLTPFIGYLIIPSVVTVITLSSLDMYKKYQRKMKALDFS